MNKIFNTLLSFVFVLALGFSANGQVAYTISGEDSFGDGWNGGGHLTITVGANAPFDFTVPDPNGDDFEMNFTAPVGATVVVDYTDGSWDIENDWVITDDATGNVINAGNGGDFDGNNQNAENVTSFVAFAVDICNACAQEIHLEDSFGDGWNGNTLTIEIGGNAYATGITMETGTNITHSYVFAAGQAVDIVYNSEGAFEDETSYTVDDGLGVEVLNETGFVDATPRTSSFVAACGPPCDFTIVGSPQNEFLLESGDCDAVANFDILLTGDCVLNEQTEQTAFGFTNDFSVSSAILTQNIPCGGTVITPTTLTLQTLDPAAFGFGGANTCLDFASVVEWTVAVDGVISFDWATVNNDPTNTDKFGYVVNYAGANYNIPDMNAMITELSNSTTSGTIVSIPVVAGDNFALVAWMGSDYFANGGNPNGGTPGELTAVVSSFEFSSLVDVVQLAGTYNVNVVVPGEGPVYVEYCLDTKNCGVICHGFNANITDNQQVSNDMSCIGHIQASMDENCDVDFTAGMFLQGTNYSCWDDYTMNVSGGYGLVNGPTSILPGEYTVTVTNASGNSCWSTLTVEDKLPPALDCDCPVGNNDPNCSIKCYNVEYGYGNMNPPVVSECSSYEIGKSDNIYGDNCVNQILIRTWTVTDEYGMVSECRQEYAVEKLTFADIVPPRGIVDLTCGVNTSMESIASIFDLHGPTTEDDLRTSPIVENHEGWPVAYPTFIVNGHPQKIDNSICNILTSKSDQEIKICGDDCNGGKKVIRTWTYMDWCTNSIGTSIQIIKATDSEAPTLLDLENIVVSTNPWGCAADICLPVPGLHDNCDGDVTYTVSIPGAHIVWDEDCNNGLGGYLAIGMLEGYHTATYYAEDCCGNVGTYSIIITVEDKTAPVVVAHPNIVVSLTSSSTTGDGIAKLYAESVDNGSHDGCTKVFFEVRRDSDVLCDFQGNTTYNADGHTFDGSANPNNPAYDPDNGAYVKFCCADLTETDANGVRFGLVDVWLRVWDLNGNFNESWTTIRVEDKLAPAIQCPVDAYVTCDMDTEDLDLVGSAHAYATCGGIEVEYTDVIENVNACGVGFIIRRWNIVGTPANYCDQRINVSPLLPFTEASIKWERNKEFVCLPNAIDGPTWVSGSCDLVARSAKTDTFKFEDGACYKVIIHWTVIDWCTYEENFPTQDPNANGIQDGIWRKDQIIKVLDETAPVLECQDEMFAVDDNADADGDGIVCEKIGLQLSNIATDEGDCASEWLKWNIDVDTWGDGVVDWRYSSFVPTNWTFARGNFKEYVAPTGNGETVTITLPEHITSSMSNHSVSWKVTDGCGNVTSCTSTFMVVDKKAPTPYCLHLSTALMQAPSCMVDIWAIDFDKASFDNCTDSESLRFTFGETDSDGNLLIPNEDVDANGNRLFPAYSAADRSSSRTFTTADLGPAPISVDMYVWDGKDNYDFCTVQLTLIANDTICNPDGIGSTIAGLVATDAGTLVADTHIGLTSTEVSRDMMANDGTYAFVFNADDTYELNADRATDYMEGISTLDLLLIQRHILKYKEFDNAYTLFAADVNNDKSITGSDIIDLRKLILGKTDRFTNNTSWRFGDKGQVFGDLDVVLAEQLAETITVDVVNNDMMHEDFVAVKVGDVNNTVDGLLSGINTDVRTNKSVILTTEEQSVVAGEEVAVTFTSENFNNVYGYQSGISLNGLELVRVEGGAIEMNDSNVAITRNGMNISWTVNAPVTVGTEGLFTIVFVATANGTLSNMINLDARSLSTEAYVGNNAEVVNLDINVKGVELTNALSQNEPNPFDVATTIAYELATAGDATLTVYDVTGKLVYTATKASIAGINKFEVSKSDLNVSGVMYYQLESGDFTATKKMIIIE